MLGAMQDWPLRVSTLIDHAAKYHGNRPIVGRSAEGPYVETTWAGSLVQESLLSNFNFSTTRSRT